MCIRRFMFPLLVMFLLGVMVACGGGQGPAEKPFKVSSVSTDIAAHGDSVMIEGAGLEGAKVFLGTLEIVPNSQSEEQISFAVPGIAPGGPQTLSIRAGDKTSNHSLFIGVDFPAGTLEDLAALNLPPGTAVRLAAHTYTSSGTVQLNNLSLYGVDPTKTILDLALLSDVPEALLALQVDSDAELVITNLAVHLGAFVVSGSGYPLFPFSLEDSAGVIDETQLNQLAETFDAGEGSLTFDNVLITDNDVGDVTLFSLIGVDATPVHVNILNSEITGEMSFVLLVASGLTIENSTIDTDMIIAGGFHEPLRVDNSRLEANHPSGSDVFILASRGLQFDNAHVVASGEIMVGDPTGTFLPVISATTVRDSSFTVLAPAGGLSPHPVFEINLAMQNALFDNVNFNIAGSSEIFFGMASQVMFNNSEFVMGDAAFQDDEAFLDFILADAVASSITVKDSSIRFESYGEIGLIADQVMDGETSIAFVGNTVAGLAGKSKRALYIDLDEIYSELAITVTDNVFTGFDSALYVQYGFFGAGFVTGEIHDNVFDFDISALGDVAELWDIDDSLAYFDASRNVWGSHTDTATVEGLIDYTGSSDPSAFKVNPITPAP